MPLTNSVLFDQGSSSNFFDANIFDCLNHYIVPTITETITVSENLSGGKSFLRTINEGGFGMFDAGLTLPLFDPAIFDTTFHSTLNATDSVISSLINFRTISETITVSESLTGVQSLIRLLSETILVSESITSPSTFIRTILEGGYIMFDGSIFDSNIFDTSFHGKLTVSDQITGTKEAVRSITEPSISVSDSISTMQSLIRTLVETVTVSDLLLRTASFLRTLPETITTNDALARQLLALRSISESPISTSDSVSANYIFHRIINETITVTDLVVGTLPPGTIKFISRIKLVLDITSQLKQTLTVSSSII